jgi:uncharacterized protein (DUF849 family)
MCEPNDPLLIMVAPTGARRTVADHPALPITADAIVETAAACFEAGAAAIHAHVRDARGKHLIDAAAYRDLIARIEARAPSMVVQVTTETAEIYSPSDQMSVLAELRPRFASVAVRELFCAEEATAAAALRSAHRDGVALQYILYDERDLARFHELAGRAVLPGARRRILLALGRYSAAQESTPAMFADLHEAMRRLELDRTTVWSVCAFGRGETACLEAAMAAGGHVRVGFENSLFNRDGRIAANNQERVREIAELAAAMGRPLARGAEAAAILGARLAD